MAAQSRSKLFPCFLILLQSLLYGFGDPISKFAFDVMPVYSLLVLRYSMALVVLLLLFGKRIWKGLKQCSVKDWLLPTLCMSGAYVVNNIALDLTAATSVAFLRSLATVMTPLLALAAYRRTYRWQHIPIQCLVVVGLYLLCGLGGLSGFGLGEVLSLAVGLAAGGVAGVRRTRFGTGGPHHPVHLTGRRLGAHGRHLRSHLQRRPPSGADHPYHLGHHHLHGHRLHPGRVSAPERCAHHPLLPDGSAATMRLPGADGSVLSVRAGGAAVCGWGHRGGHHSDLRGGGDPPGERIPCKGGGMTAIAFTAVTPVTAVLVSPDA